MSGNLTSFSSTINFSRLSDPTPSPAGNFGAGYSAVGNVVSQTGKFRNELLVGAGHLGEPGNADLLSDVHFFDPLKAQALQSIQDPDQNPASRFGAEVIPLGDLNGDGFLDFAVGAPGFSGSAGAGQGRLYIFRSDNSPAPPDPPAPTPPLGPAGAQGSPGAPGLPGAAAQVREGRALELSFSRTTVSRGKSLKLQGLLEAFAGSSACEANQQVLLQRRGSSSLRYSTFDRVTSDGKGEFSRKIKPTATSLYRAVVSQSTACLATISNRERVTVKSSKRRRGR